MHATHFGNYAFYYSPEEAALHQAWVNRELAQRSDHDDTLSIDIYDTHTKHSIWHGIAPVETPGEPATPYTSGPHGARPVMGLGFFVMAVNGRQIVYHDGDQGGFSSELLIDPAGKSASLMVVNTTDTGIPKDVSHPESNTEPDPHTDLRQELRTALIESVFPAYAGRQ